MSEFVKKILKESFEFSVFDKVKRLILSGGKQNFEFSNEEKNFLKKTVTETNYNLFRGLYFMRFRIDRKYWSIVNDLKVGDILPDFLKKKELSNDYVSYSKKMSVAKRYAKEGDICIIVEVKDNGNNILADLSHIFLLPDAKEHFDLNDLNYMKQEKEVIVHEVNIQPVIIFKSGKL